MASLAMASLMHVPMSCAYSEGTTIIFSKTSSVRMPSMSSLPASQRVPRVPQNVHWVVRASSTNLGENVQHAIEEAEQLCTTEEVTPKCAEAWDEVEELAAAMSHKKMLDKELLQSASQKVPFEQSPVSSSDGSQNSHLDEALHDAIDYAEDLCTNEWATPECAVAWDEVEELAAAAAHKKLAEKKDPLDSFRN